MYNTSIVKQAFWTSFGKYMTPVLSGNGERRNWLNYKTGLRHIYFRMDAGKDFAEIGIYLRHPREEERVESFNRFQALKSILELHTGEIWTWEKEARDEFGKSFSRIYIRKEGLNIFQRDDWPAIISFLKPRILALDNFWLESRENFE